MEQEINNIGSIVLVLVQIKRFVRLTGEGQNIHGPTAQAINFNREGCFGQAQPSPNPAFRSETGFALQVGTAGNEEVRW